MKTAVFCDFDGTISRRDIGYSLFHHFSGGRNDALIPDWKSGKLSTRDCLQQEAAMVKASPYEILNFLDQFELNQGFVEFVDLCHQNHVSLTIISDGLEFYINHVLHRYGINNLSLIANKGILKDNGIAIEFPYINRECTRCGSCKGERIQEYLQKQTEEMQIVFIGDGYSDICALPKADLIFAKKDLALYCQKKQVACTTFDTFFDIIRDLTKRKWLTGRK